MSAWDKGKAAARQGKSIKANPYDHPDRQPPGSAWERMASEWDEGFRCYDAEEDAKARSDRARAAALARWEK